MRYPDFLHAIVLAFLDLFVLPLTQAAPVPIPSGITTLSNTTRPAFASALLNAITALSDSGANFSALDPNVVSFLNRTSDMAASSDLEALMNGTPSSPLNSLAAFAKIEASRKKDKGKKMPMCPEPLKIGKYPITWDIFVYNPNCRTKIFTWWKGCDAVCDHNNGNKKQDGQDVANFTSLDLTTFNGTFENIVEYTSPSFEDNITFQDFNNTSKNIANSTAMSLDNFNGTFAEAADSTFPNLESSIALVSKKVSNKKSHLPICPKKKKNGNYAVTLDIFKHNPQCWPLWIFFLLCDIECDHSNGN